MLAINNLVHYGDMLAIPCFFIAFIYFYKINKKTLLEIFLMIFMFTGLVIDILFTIIYKMNITEYY